MDGLSLPHGWSFVMARCDRRYDHKRGIFFAFRISPIISLQILHFSAVVCMGGKDFQIIHFVVCLTVLDIISGRS